MQDGEIMALASAANIYKHLLMTRQGYMIEMSSGSSH
jgi:hypothetical protein